MFIQTHHNLYLWVQVAMSVRTIRWYPTHTNRNMKKEKDLSKKDRAVGKANTQLSSKYFSVRKRFIPILWFGILVFVSNSYLFCDSGIYIEVWRVEIDNNIGVVKYFKLWTWGKHPIPWYKNNYECMCIIIRNYKYDSVLIIFFYTHYSSMLYMQLSVEEHQFGKYGHPIIII